MKTLPTTVTFSGEDYTKLQDEINKLSVYEDKYNQLLNQMQKVFELISNEGIHIKILHNDVNKVNISKQVSIDAPHKEILYITVCNEK